MHGLILAIRQSLLIETEVHNMNTELHERLTELFIQTGQAHHQAFVDTNGSDPDWPIWYASYLREPLVAARGRARCRCYV
jgi:hypothetical protein